MLNGENPQPLDKKAEDFARLYRQLNEASERGKALREKNRSDRSHAKPPTEPQEAPQPIPPAAKPTEPATAAPAPGKSVRKARQPCPLPESANRHKFAPMLPPQLILADPARVNAMSVRVYAWMMMAARGGEICTNSQRVMAAELRVSPDTIQRSLDQLEAAGFIRTQPDTNGNADTYLLLCRVEPVRPQKCGATGKAAKMRSLRPQKCGPLLIKSHISKTQIFS
jgi:hypothetical protein